MSGVMVHMRHLREANFCSRGARMWFSQRGLDYNTFLKEGLPVETLEATGDALAMRVCALAREEAEDEQ